MNSELIKEKIAWYKLLFTVLVTITAGSIGWFVNNYNKAIPAFVVIDILTFTSFWVGIALCVTKIRFYFNKLGEI